MTRLKACPFCGGAARTTRFRFAMATKYMIECAACKVSFYLDNLKEARTRWNRRTEHDREARSRTEGTD